MTPQTKAPQGTGSSSSQAPADTGHQQLPGASKGEIERTALKIDLIAAVRDKLEITYNVELPLDFGTLCMNYEELEIRHAFDHVQTEQHQMDKNNCMGRPDEVMRAWNISLRATKQSVLGSPCRMHDTSSYAQHHPQ